MIFLHIGYPKTGTTTIQSGLLDNRRLLKEYGYYYPKSGIFIHGHHNIYYELASKEQTVKKLSNRFVPENGSLTDLIKEIQDIKYADPAANFIISSEAFFTLKEPYYKKLITALSAVDKITAVIVLRRQDQWLRSFWSMEVGRMNTTQTFEEWVEKKALPRRANINMTLGRLKKWCPRVNYAVYGFDEFKKGGLIEFFLKVCDLPDSILTNLQQPEALNESFGYSTLDFFRCMSAKYGTDMSPLLKETFKGYLRTKSHKWRWGTKFDKRLSNNITQVTEAFIRDKYSETNNKVSKRYPNVASTLAFPQPKKKKKRIITKRSIPFLHRMWVELWLVLQIRKEKKEQL